jgi:hypothetical protein
MKTRAKAFKRAKNQAERIRLAQEAARDPGFEPVLPTSMNYNIANYQNKGKGTLWLDVDEVLLSESGDEIRINDEFIDACVKEGYTDGYLVTSMSFKVDTRFNRVDLIAYLALRGLNVRGLIAEADAAPEAQLGDFYTDYYRAVINSLIGREVDPKVKKKQDDRKTLAEQVNDDYLKEKGKDPLAFGKKLMMVRKLLFENPKIKKLIFADDSIVNLYGVTNDYMADPYHAAALCMLPIAKMSSKVASAKEYRGLLKQFDQGKHESDEAYKARMIVLLFQLQLINLDQRTVNGPKALPQFGAFRASLVSASVAFNQKTLDIGKIISDVYSALSQDYAAYAESLNSGENSQSVMAMAPVIFDRFRELEGVLLNWQKALAPELRLPTPTIAKQIRQSQAVKSSKEPSPEASALAQHSTFRRSKTEKVILHPDRKPPRPQ